MENIILIFKDGEIKRYNDFTDLIRAFLGQEYYAKSEEEQLKIRQEYAEVERLIFKSAGHNLRVENEKVYDLENSINISSEKSLVLSLCYHDRFLLLEKYNNYELHTKEIEELLNQKDNYVVLNNKKIIQKIIG